MRDRRATQRRYRKSSKGQAAALRYEESAKGRERRQRGREGRQRRNQQNGKTYREANHAFLNDWKSSGCFVRNSECSGELEAHHVDPDLKSFCISHAYRYPPKTFECEVEEKCVPLCKGHHDQVTRNLGGELDNQIRARFGARLHPLPPLLQIMQAERPALDAKVDDLKSQVLKLALVNDEMHLKINKMEKIVSETTNMIYAFMDEMPLQMRKEIHSAWVDKSEWMRELERLCAPAEVDKKLSRINRLQ